MTDKDKLADLSKWIKDHEGTPSMKTVHEVLKKQAMAHYHVKSSLVIEEYKAAKEKILEAEKKKKAIAEGKCPGLDE